jgi:taurine dioxygenase
VPVEGRHLERQYGIGGLSVEPLTPVIGARVQGLDLSGPLGARQKGWLAEAVRRHKVLFFRAPGLTLDALVAWGRALGTLQSYAPASALLEDRRPAAYRDHPEVQVFEYDETQRGREAFWHFDVLPSRRPARAALLRARVVPEVGGDTLFCDLEAVYASLPAALKSRLDGAVALYDLLFERRLARFRGLPEAEAMALAPDPLLEMPLVTRPSRGAKVLFLNPAFLVGIKGLPEDEWRSIAADLRARIDRPEFQCRHRWRTDDVALWDNHTCLHYATNDYWPRERLMERVSVVDEVGASFLEEGVDLECRSATA